MLALQGDFEAHRKVLEGLNVSSVEVRTARDLAQADALILPGGESTTIIKLLERIGLDKVIQDRFHAGMPVYGTCAGMILLSRSVEDRPEQPTLGLLDATVARNAFGAQIDSFEADIPFRPGDNGAESPVRGVFIRAPYLTEIGDAVDVLGRFQDKIVAVQQGVLLATAFHPELTRDATVHSYFVRMVAASKEQRG
ncbi:MAG: pyridoxal phosphate synthase yaaE subunit [Chthonomonadaceae bacterium]|nr:pyridoxal phosphate synthase yaaE subunit [Chthonomonadaceae bacterium]